jgi:hypothetical protein
MIEESKTAIEKMSEIIPPYIEQFTEEKVNDMMVL